jgi:diguanylate cyclase (GGDEF)-like protein/PAS domain S-box-containing protein
MICNNFSEPILHLLSVSPSHGEPETILSTIYEHSSDGIFILEPVSLETSLDTYSPPSHLSTTLTHSQPDAIDFRFLFANRTYLQLLSLDPHKIIGRSLQEFIPEVIRRPLEHHLMTCLQQKNINSYQQTFTTEEGGIERLLTLSPILNHEGKVSKIVGICQNMIELCVLIHHQRYRNFFENAVAGIYQTTPDGHYQIVNPMLARIYGYESPQELITTINDIAHQLYVDHRRRDDFRLLIQEKGAIWGFESQVYRKDKSIIWISENGRAIWDAKGEIIAYEGTVEDITQRKQAEEELWRRDKLLQGVAKAMHHLLTDRDHNAAILKALATLGEVTEVDRVYIYESQLPSDSKTPILTLRFQWFNPSSENESTSKFTKRITSQLGLSQWSKIRENYPIVTHFLKNLSQEERQILEQEKLLEQLIIPIRVDKKTWGYLSFDEGSYPQNWSEGEVSILMAIGDSIGGALQRQKTEALIRYQALHDRLTGLPNRTLLNERLSQALQKARHGGTNFALMFLDLDYFKDINDTLGHAIGDLLLQSIAKRLTASLRDGDIVARWGGDEFIILLSKIYREKDAVTIAQRILDILHPPFDLAGHQVTIGCSIGIALYPEDGEDTETLMKKADTALYRAKDSGRNNYQL